MLLCLKELYNLQILWLSFIPSVFHVVIDSVVGLYIEIIAQGQGGE